MTNELSGFTDYFNLSPALYPAATCTDDTCCKLPVCVRAGDDDSGCLYFCSLTFRGDLLVLSMFVQASSGNADVFYDLPNVKNAILFS